MNSHLLLSAVSTIVIFLCYLETMNCSISAPLGSDVDTNAFFMWYILPSELKKRLAFDLKATESAAAMGRPSNEIVREDLRVLPAAYFRNLIERDVEWVDNCECLGEEMDKYHLKTHTRLFIEALKNAPNHEIQALFKKAPEMVKKVLNKLIEGESRELVVKLLTQTLKSGEEVIELLKLFERTCDIFDLSDEWVMRILRSEAYRKDDLELMNFTDEYPEVIDQSSKDQIGLIHAIRSDRIPNDVWKSFCSKRDSNMPILCKPYCEFIKFPIFSHPINTENWTLTMLALAIERYDLARELPLKRAHELPVPLMQIPFPQNIHITAIEQLLPFIPDERVRTFIVDNNQFLPKSLIHPLTEFSTLDKNDSQIRVRVLKEREREPFRNAYLLIDTDTDAVTDLIFRF